MAERSYPYAWLGILAAAPPSTDEVIYCRHDNGFALHSMRTPEIGRLYLQVPADEDIAAWPDDRIWDELRRRLAVPGWSLRTGPVLQKSITPMRSFVAAPMRYGNLFLAGDAAHIVPPTGAKGLNLAVADVAALATALIRLIRDGERELADAYSDHCLERVWRATHLSWWMTSMLHVVPGAGPVRVRAAARPAAPPGDVKDRGRHAGRDVHGLRPAPLRPVDPPRRGGAVGSDLGRLAPERRRRRASRAAGCPASDCRATKIGRAGWRASQRAADRRSRPDSNIDRLLPHIYAHGAAASGPRSDGGVGQMTSDDGMDTGKANKGGVSRRAVLMTGAVTGAAAAGSMAIAGTAAAAPERAAAAGNGRGTSPDGDLILYNGRIHTMDEAKTVASVVAIRGGVVVYVGSSLGAAEQQFASRPQVIDLHGRMAVPGLIDCHNHFVLMGNRPGHHTPLENAYSIADVQALYAARAAALPKSPNPPVSADNFITTIGGFSPNQFKEVRLPTLAELDAAVPNHPVYIPVGFTGPAVTNTLGKAFFENVTGPFPVTVGADGSIAASPFVGNGPTTAALLALRQTLTLDDRKASVRDAMAYAASVGVTTHLDQGAFQATNTPADGAAHEDNYTMYAPSSRSTTRAASVTSRRGRRAIVRLRINYLLFDSNPSIPVATARMQNAFPFFGDDLVRTGAIGEFLADISLYAGGNQTWMNAALAAAKAGWRAEVHSLTADRLPVRDRRATRRSTRRSRSPTCAGWWRTCRSSPRTTRSA